MHAFSPIIMTLNYDPMTCLLETMHLFITFGRFHWRRMFVGFVKNVRRMHHNMFSVVISLDVKIHIPCTPFTLIQSYKYFALICCENISLPSAWWQTTDLSCITRQLWIWHVLLTVNCLVMDLYIVQFE